MPDVGLVDVQVYQFGGGVDVGVVAVDTGDFRMVPTFGFTVLHQRNRLSAFGESATTSLEWGTDPRRDGPGVQWIRVPGAGGRDSSQSGWGLTLICSWGGLRVLDESRAIGLLRPPSI